MEQPQQQDGDSSPFSSVPVWLTIHPHWVVWKFEERASAKPAKAPYSPRTGHKALPDDPHTWDTFAVALEAYKSGIYDGIGFFFSEHNPYTGIDLDNCRDPQSGESESWAKKIVEEFATYTEISPSGTGLHVIVQGQLIGCTGLRKNFPRADGSKHTATSSSSALLGSISAELRRPSHSDRNSWSSGKP